METTQLYRNNGKHSLTYKPNILEIWQAQLSNKRRNDVYTIQWWHHSLHIGGCKRDLATKIFITKYTVDVYVMDFYFLKRFFHYF
jgi:hypothetical protein